MPAFDGTGPRGAGPMSGRGRGYCVLQSKNDSKAPVVGFAGRAGLPVGGLPTLARELALLRNAAREVENSLRLIRLRIDLLEHGPVPPPRRDEPGKR